MYLSAACCSLLFAMSVALPAELGFGAGRASAFSSLPAGPHYRTRGAGARPYQPQPPVDTYPSSSLEYPRRDHSVDTKQYRAPAAPHGDGGFQGRARRPLAFSASPVEAEKAVKHPDQPYNYDYTVSDQYSGANFAKQEDSDGKQTVGSYSVSLPDGRIQHVKYVADQYSGFQAVVTYEGEAHYPEEQKPKEEPRQQQSGYQPPTGPGGFRPVVPTPQKQGRSFARPAGGLAKPAGGFAPVGGFAKPARGYGEPIRGFGQQQKHGNFRAEDYGPPRSSYHPSPVKTAPYQPQPAVAPYSQPEPAYKHQNYQRPPKY